MKYNRSAFLNTITLAGIPTLTRGLAILHLIRNFFMVKDSEICREIGVSAGSLSKYFSGQVMVPPDKEIRIERLLRDCISGGRKALVCMEGEDFSDIYNQASTAVAKAIIEAAESVLAEEA